MVVAGSAITKQKAPRAPGGPLSTANKEIASSLDQETGCNDAPSGLPRPYISVIEWLKGWN